MRSAWHRLAVTVAVGLAWAGLRGLDVVEEALDDVESEPDDQALSKMPASFHVALDRWTDRADTRALLALWGEIYGERPDLSRPMVEIAQEVEVGLTWLVDP